jgi:dipeptidyl aminopeptidase/acylaminoacyl peptidase
MHRGSLTVLLLAAVFVTAASAQQPAARKKITVKEMLAQPTFGGYQLSPDGNQVMFTRTDRDPKDWAATSHIWLHDLATGKSFQLTSSAKGESNPRWLPDGRIAFVSNRDTKNAWWVISPAGGEATKLFDDENAPGTGTFFPDLKRVVFSEQTERPDKKEWDDKVKKKDDGYLFEKRLQFSQVFVYDGATKKKKQLTSGPLDHQGPSLSPDGKWIAYSVNKNGLTVRDANWSDNSDLYVIPADSGEARQLTTNEGPDNGAVWSPDGQFIAYSSSEHKTNSANQNDVKVVRASGGQPLNLTADLDYSISNIEWSKDGKFIYFATAEGLTSKLYKVAAAGGKPVEIAFGKDFVFGDFNASKDGVKWLVTGGSLMDPGIVYVAAADGKTPRRILSDLNRTKDFELAKAEPISWKGADGWEIEGILTYPLGYEAGKRYPLVLEIHGGPHGRYSANFSQGAQIWAARGYAVLQGNPRGSSGRTFEFSNANKNDWGGKDFQDIMKGVDFVIERGVADPERMGVMGGSYGGFMTFWTVTQTDRFKAAIGHAGISDWYAFFGQTDIPNLLEFGFGGLPSESKATYEKWSPIEYAARVKTPLLITHGENDQRVPIPQAEEYYRLLKKLGKPSSSSASRARSWNWRAGASPAPRSGAGEVVLRIHSEEAGSSGQR